MNDDMRAAEASVLRVLEATDEPVTPEQLLEEATAGDDLSSVTVRRALWHLVSAGLVEFTRDMRVSLTTAESAR